MPHNVGTGFEKRGWIRLGVRRRLSETRTVSLAGSNPRACCLTAANFFFGNSADVTPKNALGVLVLDSTVSVMGDDELMTLTFPSKTSPVTKALDLLFEEPETRIEWQAAVEFVLQMLPAARGLQAELYPRRSPRRTLVSAPTEGKASTDANDDDLLDIGLNDLQPSAQEAEEEVPAVQYPLWFTIATADGLDHLRACPRFSATERNALITQQLVGTGQRALCAVCCLEAEDSPLLVAKSYEVVMTKGNVIGAQLSSKPIAEENQLKFSAVPITAGSDELRLETSNGEQLSYTGSDWELVKISAGKGKPTSVVHPLSQPQSWVPRNHNQKRDPAKVLLVGATGSGKSTILRWLQEESTEGIGTGSVVFTGVGGVDKLLQIDVGGALLDVEVTELPGSASNQLLKSRAEDADIIIFTFDFTDAFTLSWLSNFRSSLSSSDSLHRRLLFAGMKHLDARVMVDSYRLELSLREAAQAIGCPQEDVVCLRIPSFNERERHRSAFGSFAGGPPDDSEAVACDLFLDGFIEELRRLAIRRLLVRHGLHVEYSVHIESVLLPSRNGDAGPPLSRTAILSSLSVLRPIQESILLEVDAICGSEGVSNDGVTSLGESTVWRAVHPGIALVSWICVASRGGGGLYSTYIRAILDATVIDCTRGSDEEPPTVKQVLRAVRTNASQSHFFTAGNIRMLFRALHLELSPSLVKCICRSIDINGDTVVDLEEVTRWAEFPEAVSLQYGVVTAVVAGLWKHRMLVEGPRYVHAFTTTNGVSNTGGTSDPTTSGPSSGPAEGSAPADGNCCSRCSAQFGVFRSSSQCVQCRQLFCDQCIGEVATIESGGSVSAMVCNSCQGVAMPTQWESDSAVKSCSLCDTHFSLLRRRHHCRACGAVVCAECSPHVKQVAGYAKPQRVCSACAAADRLNKKRGMTVTPSKSPRVEYVDPEAAAAAELEEMVRNRRRMTSEIEYELAWYEEYDSEDEQALFRAPPPPQKPNAALQEYLVLMPGAYEADEGDVEGISEVDLELMAPEMF